MSDTTREAIAVMRRSHDELATVVRGFDDDALQRRSGASEWTVADVLSHLGSAAEIGLRTLTTGQPDMDGARAVWDRWNAMSPSEQASSFVTAEGAFVEAFEGIDDDAWAHRTLDLGFLPAPVGIPFFAAMRLSEVGLHRWDIAVAFDATATVPGYLVPFVLELLPQFASFFARPIGKGGRIGVETSDPSRAYVLELGDAGASLRSGQATDTDHRLTLPGEAFLRLTGGRLDPDHTPASVHVDGDVSLDDLRRVFPGY
jgi:uncharacterized protein (TIGR03083 family)